MKSVLGIFLLGVGAASALTGMALLLRGVLTSSPRYIELGRKTIYVLAACAICAALVMEWALLSHDFSIKYVVANNARSTPLLFTITGLWAALQGSILLWALILSGYLVFVAVKFRARRADPLISWALIVGLGVALFFFVLMLGPANPFVRTPGVIPLDGQGPNPLLQNHVLMLFHPPILYTGLVGFTVPFMFATAALITGRFGEGWLADVRRSTLIAWGFLTIGIILGAWWSYEVLGWGGYWAWDPVENAVLLPWLTGTAFLHSVMVQERRGMLRVWNLSLVLSTFCLTILTTFLTRSGILNSVHAFSESDLGPWLLTFLGACALLGVGLIAWRGDSIRAPGQIDSPVSRESAFLINNLLFASFAFVVLLGTIFPLIVEALQNRQLSVGEPYFDRMTIPIALALLFMMAIGPALPWRATSSAVIRDRLRIPATCAALVMVGSVWFGLRGPFPVLALGLASFALAMIVRQVFVAWRAQARQGQWSPLRLLRSNPRLYGGLIVHVGVVCIAVAITLSSALSTKREVQLNQGQATNVAGFHLTYLGSAQSADAQRTQFKARIQVMFHGRKLGVYAPAISSFPGQAEAIGTPSVHSGLTRDLYLTMISSPSEKGRITLGVSVKPMMIWLWTGGGIMGLGVLLALVPTVRRRRIKTRTPAASPPSRELDDVLV